MVNLEEWRNKELKRSHEVVFFITREGEKKEEDIKGAMLICNFL